MKCEAFRQVQNLAAIFCDGQTALFYYDGSTGTYCPAVERSRQRPLYCPVRSGYWASENGGEIRMRRQSIPQRNRTAG